MGALFLAVALAPPGRCAQPGTAKRAPAKNRCLLIVDTSRPMQRRDAATLKVVQDLVTSGLNGQLRSGDNLGLWTFNEDLYSGQFPLQIWSPEARWDVAARVQTFLKAQKYQKKPNFDKVLPALAYVVEQSPRLTVILINSGEERIHGTPFDERIAQFYEQWRDQQEKERMPFVTVLRAQDGRLVDFALNTPPWPLQLPKLPQEAPTAETARAQGPPKEPTNTVPPLIVVGKKPRPPAPPAPAPPPATIRTQAATAATAALATGNVAVASASTPAPTAVKAPVKPALPSASDVHSKPPTSPPPSAAVVPAAPPSNSIAPLPPKPKAGASAPQRARAQPTPSTNAQAQAVPAPATNPAPKGASRPAPPAQTGSATPAEGLSSLSFLWLVVLIVGVILAAIIMLLVHRSRSATHGSLITRSYNRDKKP